MLKQTGATATQEDLKADVGIDTVPILITADFGKPDVTTGNTFTDLSLDSFICPIPPVLRYVYASLSPREFVARCLDKFEDVWVDEVRWRTTAPFLYTPPLRSCSLRQL